MNVVKFKSREPHITHLINPISKNHEKKIIFFSKLELTSILSLYSRQVAKGLWKDYALDNQNGTAIFSIFRHTHDKPIYRIVKKKLKGLKKRNEFLIIKDAQIINKSSELLLALSKFEKKISIIRY